MTRVWALSIAVAALALTATAAEDDVKQPRTALIVVDIQQFYFPGGQLPLVGPEAAAANARRALDAFRRRGWPVVHVQHLPATVATADQEIADLAYRFNTAVAPLPGEKLVGKHEANAFRGTDLEAWLRSQGVKRLVVVGMQTHMCVEAATRAAADLGFEVVVLHDACATRALSFAGTEVPAAQVHAATLASLSSAYARVLSVDEWLAETEPAAAK
jgi:nicotinamidase-related amidase